MQENFPHKPTNAKADAAILKKHHERCGSGFYASFGGRYFHARATKEGLYVSDGHGAAITWHHVPEGTTFHSAHGRPIYMTA